ncbi:MAG: DinB family protein [Chloroflexota bacterium]
MTREAASETFAGFPARLAVVALAAAERPVPDGEWTPEQVARHLIAVEIEVHHRRVDDLAREPSPHWSWTEPGPWDGEPELGLAGVLERFTKVRAATVALARSLDDAAWGTTGKHDVYGDLDGDGLIALAAAHDEEHLTALRG